MPYQENIDHLKKIFPEGIPSQITVRLEDDIDHTFHVVDRPCLPWSDAIRSPFSNALRNFLTDWISENIESNDGTEIIDR